MALAALAVAVTATVAERQLSLEEAKQLALKENPEAVLAEAGRNINEVGRKMALEKLKTSVEKEYMEVLKAERLQTLAKSVEQARENHRAGAGAGERNC